MVNVGTPAACFLPARAYKFGQATGLATLTIPVKGTFPEDAPYSGDYDICPQPGVFLFGTMTEVLFAHKIYPKMEDNQRFVIAGLEVIDDHINIVGRLISLMED